MEQKETAKLISQRRLIGTKDFNRLGNLKDELKSINETMELTLNDIKDLKMNSILINILRKE